MVLEEVFDFHLDKGTTNLLPSRQDPACPVIRCTGLWLPEDFSKQALRLLLQLIRSSKRFWRAFLKMKPLLSQWKTDQTGNNIEFTELVGLQMAKNCTTRKVRSDCPKSAQRFALTMKILSVIYKLVHTDTYATKRDIFYENVQLYGSQTTVDNIVTDISCMLKIPRRSLHILSTSKGCVAGNLLYIEQDGTKVDCSFNTSGVLVPSNVEGVTNATFQRLLDDDFCGKCGPCILITGKGVPDLNTRLFVRKLWNTFQIPIFTLVDADPHGMIFTK
ncbi:unnamed protein product [Ranitomeya imitator]|uniref:DNA topoisomerase (ATP-hydrolyzing) n=1 Tax=Ranitomeya imitator TaxID=111125 RepID=A0ABN9LCI9_9NEOB|nr:unnamed protein product [Ranitomeya imitator]